jgi:apolipoprotein N-acyltransferase
MMPRRPAVAALVAALLGAACVLGFAPFDAWPGAWLIPVASLGGLFLLCRATPGAGRAAGLGFAWGTGFFLCGVSWVYVSLSEFGGMAAPAAAAATLAFCLYLALFPAAVAWAFRRLAGADSRPVVDALRFAGLWTLGEWLRGTLFTGFPWLAIGYAQSPPSPLAGWASVLGVYGLCFLVALIGGLLAAWRRPGIWAIVLALLGSGALLRAMDWTQPVGPPLKVALLQGSVPQSLKWDPRRLPLSIETYLGLARANPAPLVVLPETAIPLYFSEVPREVLRGLTANGEALVGVAIGTTDGGYTNGAVALTPQLAVSAYAKRHLVPFGEYPPPGFAWFFRYARIPMSNFTAGPASQAPLEIAGQRIAPNICYEDLFGEELLPSLPSATLLVNLSNTAWFGRSLAQPQHLQIAKLRALETGRSMLRATNTGMTALVTPDGRVAAALPPFQTSALVVEAQGRSGLTPYARWGNALALLLALGACLPALRRRR